MRLERISVFNRDVLWGVVLISLSFLTVALIPFVGSVTVMMIPLPVIFFLGKLGRLRGLFILAVSLLIVDVIVRSMVAEGGETSLFLLLGFMGVAIYEGLRKNLSIEKTVFFAVTLSVFFAVLLLLFQSAILGEMPWAVVNAYITKSFQESIELSAQMGAQGEQVALIKNNMDMIIRSLLYVFPALSLIGIAFVVCLNILFGRVLFLVNGIAYPDFGELTQWRAPDGTVWILIMAGAAVLIPSVLGLKNLWMVIAGLNILIVVLFTYFLQGLAIIEFYFKTRQVPRLLRFMFYFLLMIQQYLVVLVSAAGLFDLWVDFRRLNRKPQEPEA